MSEDEIVLPTVTLKIVEIEWPQTQVASLDGKQPYIPKGNKVYAIQEQTMGRYYHWAYITSYVEIVLQKLSQTLDAKILAEHFHVQPKAVSGRYRD